MKTPTICYSLALGSDADGDETAMVVSRSIEDAINRNIDCSFNQPFNHSEEAFSSTILKRRSYIVVILS